MRLDEIATGSTVFIDANIFVYHFLGQSNECTGLLLRCAREEMAGITSVCVCLEALHRLMCVEAVQAGLVSPGNVVRKLQRRPEIVTQLTHYHRHGEQIPEMGIQVLSLDASLVTVSQQGRSAHGLLVNDSIVLATMRDQGIRVLATNDQAFEDIPQIVVAKPGDVEPLHAV